MCSINQSILSLICHMWQSRVEIEHYFVAYFDCITAFEVLWRRTSVKGGALGKFMNTYHVYTAHISPTLNGSSVVEHFERSNGIEIHNEIMFNFYLGLPHNYILLIH